jgi:hypothetical protein
MDGSVKRLPFKNKAKKSGFRRRIKSIAGMKGVIPELDGYIITASGEIKNLRQENFEIFKKKLAEYANAHCQNPQDLVEYFTEHKRPEIEEPEFSKDPT